MQNVISVYPCVLVWVCVFLCVSVCVCVCVCGCLPNIPVDSQTVGSRKTVMLHHQTCQHTFYSQLGHFLETHTHTHTHDLYVCVFSLSELWMNITLIWRLHICFPNTSAAIMNHWPWAVQLTGSLICERRETNDWYYVFGLVTETRSKRQWHWRVRPLGVITPTHHFLWHEPQWKHSLYYYISIWFV